MELRGVDYFIAQVDGRTNAFGSWPSLFRVGLEPAPAAPALAATGADASAPLALAALLLLAGGAAVGIRRRSRAEV
jgi:LPXTG-motif cell wall-anchored protein